MIITVHQKQNFMIEICKITSQITPSCIWESFIEKDIPYCWNNFCKQQAKEQRQYYSVSINFHTNLQRFLHHHINESYISTHPSSIKYITQLLLVNLLCS